jgi:uncharacterized membrane protein YbhN (UPF0104 family)
MTTGGVLPRLEALKSLWDRWHKPLLGLAGLAVLGLLFWQARKLDWPAAFAAIRAMSPLTLAAAVLLAALGHANYGCFDLLSQRYLGFRLARWRTWLIATVSYAFNLNLGSAIGGAAIRWRLYARQGVRPGVIAQVFSLGVFTNWIGYALLAGTVLLFGQGWFDPSAPGEEADGMARVAHVVRGWLAGNGPLLIGSLLLLLVVAYAALVLWGQGREADVRGHRLHVPTRGLAVTQVVVSVLNWSLIAAVVWVLLGGEVSYGQVLATQVLASIVMLMIHVPGGLGVLEAVYLTMLHDAVGGGPLLGALLVFRVVYFFLPLAWACGSYLFLERLRPQPA